jgi:hypothetical protein
MLWCLITHQGELFVPEFHWRRRNNHKRKTIGSNISLFLLLLAAFSVIFVRFNGIMTNSDESWSRSQVMWNFNITESPQQSHHIAKAFIAKVTAIEAWADYPLLLNLHRQRLAAHYLPDWSICR